MSFVFMRLPHKLLFTGFATALLLVGAQLLATPALAQADLASPPEPSVSADAGMAELPLVDNALPNDQPDEFYRGEVIEVLADRTEEYAPGFVDRIQDLRVRITSGAEKGQVVTVSQNFHAGMNDYRAADPGDRLVLYKNHLADGSIQYYVSDRMRLGTLIWVLLGFAAVAVFFGRRKGLGALLGLVFSIAVLTLYVVPRIVAGGNPLLVTLIGTFIIACVSLFLAHGWNRRTWVALASTLATLAVATGLAQLLVHVADLFGQGTEEAFYLQVGSNGTINLQGLLLAGIVIGTLGVLDDITTAQTAVVGELRQANPNLRFGELYRRALVVGREHIASLVNTLVLAYAGAALPLFIIFTVSREVPLWVTLNSELVAEEFVRTIVGSGSLILAVPIATVMAAHFLQKEPLGEAPAGPRHSH
jgi:uncharacterized membrane protein